MATVYSLGPGTYALGAAQTGNVSSDVLDRGSDRGTAALVITSAVGATPTVTAAIVGSVDGTDYFSVPYAIVATPSTWVVAAITITSAVTTTYLLQPSQAWRYIRVDYSANTNVTLTTTAYI